MDGIRHKYPVLGDNKSKKRASEAFHYLARTVDRKMVHAWVAHGAQQPPEARRVAAGSHGACFCVLASVLSLARPHELPVCVCVC